MTYIHCDLYEKCLEIKTCVDCDKNTRFFNIACASGGIGDNICACYVLAGIKKKYPNSKIRFFTRNPGWLEIVDNIELFPFEDTCSVNNYSELFYSYNDELKQDLSRKDWYGKPLGIIPSQPILKKEIIEEIKKKKYFDWDYIVLVPFSYWEQRNWPLSHWLYLECSLKGLGIQAIILDGPGDPSRHSCFQGMRAWGLPPKDVYNILYHARMVIGNDSGMTHLAGMLNIPTLAIIAHLTEEKLFSYTNIKSVTADKKNAPCIGCSFQQKSGYKAACDKGCFALQSITPTMVIKKMNEILKSPNI